MVDGTTVAVAAIQYEEGLAYLVVSIATFTVIPNNKFNQFCTKTYRLPQTARLSDLEQRLQETKYETEQHKSSCPTGGPPVQDSVWEGARRPPDNKT